MVKLNGTLKASLRWAALLIVLVAGSVAALAQPASNHYALVLADPPVSALFASKEAFHLSAAQSYRQQIEARHRSLKADLESRGIEVTGSVTTVLNAVFVVAPASRVGELKALPGVVDVVPMRAHHRLINKATQLLNTPAAWAALGGVQNAGAGVKIAILDTGIDQNHPAFQDSSLRAPSGYPKCTGDDCKYTNNKVIAARSYVKMLAAGTDSTNPAADSRPDDYSPRDRSGHGTAVASCAAAGTNTGSVTFNGMAPKAYLGNYKIYGSPEVNDTTFDDVMIQALEDAINDGMDVISLSSGGPAFTGPLDTGAACGRAAGVACDLAAQAYENAAKSGVLITVAAGNSGRDGYNYPTYNSIQTPGDAPSLLSVGAITNSHMFAEAVRVDGPNVPSNLKQIPGAFGNSYIPIGAVAAPVRDVTVLGDNGYACSALPAGSLTGTFALIQRSPNACVFAVKMANAQAAGAQGVIFYMSDSSSLVTPSGLSAYDIPAIMISNADGLALKNYIAANPAQTATIDANGIEQDLSPTYPFPANRLIWFSSMGPTTGDSLLKPDLVAVGFNVYMAAQSYDPLGDKYSSNGYVLADGTSFATPLVAGAAALVKQAHPGFTAAQIKSALVNTASQDVTQDDEGNAVGVRMLGAGKLDVGAAINAPVAINPASISFGAVTALPLSRTLQITNNTSSAVTLLLSLSGTPPTGTTLALDKQAVPLGANATGAVTVTLSGSVPASGSYSGVLLVQAASTTLRVPYLYMVGSGTPANMVPVLCFVYDFHGTVGQQIPEGSCAFKLIDAAGLPVANAPATFTPLTGRGLQPEGSLRNVSATTDQFGIAAADVYLGSTPGTYGFQASAGGMSLSFYGTARRQPSVPSNGIANAASFDNTKPVAPGSYISIFGTNLSDSTGPATTLTLPLAIDYANVSFDVPSAKISVPGRLTYASPGQINLQVPWELQGQSSAQMKVTIDWSPGNVVTIPLSDYSPAFFEIGSGQVAALDTSYKLIGSGNPAHSGQTVLLYANGLGAVTNQPASGEPATASPLSWTASTPVVTVGGKPAIVQFSGLAPGFPALYQLNVTLPSGLTAGSNTATVAIGGQTSKTSNILIQ